MEMNRHSKIIKEDFRCIEITAPALIERYKSLTRQFKYTDKSSLKRVEPCASARGKLILQQPGTAPNSCVVHSPKTMNVEKMNEWQKISKSLLQLQQYRTPSSSPASTLPCRIINLKSKRSVEGQIHPAWQNNPTIKWLGAFYIRWGGKLNHFQIKMQW